MAALEIQRMEGESLDQEAEEGLAEADADRKC